MKKILIFLILFNLSFANTYADNKYFLEGVKLFEKKEFDNAKFKFEQDIVFNPKSELSYLYLAKIFKGKNNDNLTEQNLDTVILINPQNEEALYEMIVLKIKKSDFTKTEKLLKISLRFVLLYVQKKRNLITY